MTGLQAVSGIGDVKVQPSEEHPESVVLIQLSSPDGVAVLPRQRSGPTCAASCCAPATRCRPAPSRTI